jgi:hypothetical protein
VEIHVIKGFNARKPKFADGKDAGFTPLLPGHYSGEINADGDLCLSKSNGDVALISVQMREEKIAGGFMVVTTR